jgi:hypothetical protein
MIKARMLYVGGIVLVLLAMAGCSVPSTGNGPTPPGAPTGITATAVSTTEVDVSWPPTAGATSYNLYWTTAAGDPKATGTPVAGVSSPYKHTALTIGTTYHYAVTAITASGESTESAVVNGTPAPFIAAAFVVDGTGSVVGESVNVMTAAIGGTGISGATVTATVNSGAPNTLTEGTNAAGVYGTPNGTGGTFSINYGDSVSLSVSISGDPVVYTGSATQFTTYPGNIVPANGTSTNNDASGGNNPFDITWAAGSPTTGAQYGVAIVTQGPTPTVVYGPVYYSAPTTVTVPGGTLPNLGPFSLIVSILNGSNGSGTAIPSALPGSNLIVAGAAIVTIYGHVS